MRAPTITVVIPTYDRPADLAACLQALTRQDYPRDRWGVVVVNDGTPDPDRLDRALAPLRDQLDFRLVSQANAGPAAARNTGAAEARLDYVAFTDDDCRPRADWLSELAAAFERTPDAVLGGRAVNRLESNLCSEASHQLVEYVIDYFLRSGSTFFPSNNVALPRALFDSLGGFDADFPRAAGEDRDFCAKCRAAGVPLILAPGAIVEHGHPLGLGQFLRQHYNYGRGAFLYHRLEAGRGARGLRVEPLRFYFDLVRTPFRAGNRRRGRIRVAALLVLSQAANAIGFFAERFDRKNRRANASAAAPGRDEGRSQVGGSSDDRVREG